MGIVFLMNPFAHIYYFLFQKNLNFKIISLSAIISSFISTVSAYIFLKNGYGIHSLVYSYIIKALINDTILIIYGRKLFRPKIYLSFKGIKNILTYGAYRTGEKILNYIFSQFDIILITKLLDLHNVGIYHTAKQITNKPYWIISPIINKVMFPAMSKLENDKQLLTRAYVKFLNYLCSISFPIYFLIIAYAGVIVNLLLGEKWYSSVPIIQLLAFYFIFRIVGNPIGTLLISIGKANISFYLNIFTLVLTVIAVLIGSIWGVYGITISLSIAFFLLIFIEWFLLIKKYVDTTFKDYIKTIFKPFFISAISIAPVYLLHLDRLNVLVILLFILNLIVYGVLSYILNRDFILIIKDFIWKKKG